MPDAVPITNKLVPFDLPNRLSQIKPPNEGPHSSDFPDFENNRFPFNIIDPVPAQNPLSGPRPLHCMVNVNIQFGPPSVDSTIQVAFGTANPDKTKLHLEQASDILV
jgi:hypothetical protein